MSLAAYKGQANVLVLLFGYKVDPNYHDPDGQTPLLLSVDQGHEESTRVLLDNNAAPDCRDSDGQTPLFYAASNGWVGIAQLLLAKSANPNAMDVRGQTPLSQAMDNGYLEVVQVLLGHGARSPHSGRARDFDVSRRESWENPLDVWWAKTMIMTACGCVVALNPPFKKPNNRPLSPELREAHFHQRFVFFKLPKSPPQRLNDQNVLDEYMRGLP
ncbi:uncharacterized protein N7506_000969 [Penicillium brevicompactum]|uniref:uncharacterized protein n=1 Tax=Penicillium brevicompactum TaxID=5074 RepID=UPI00253FC641|nr:uncharacterized protein N7506_000969 [Penicillium brevicompactum]KAJ5347716.1 hypothetical protein N7506_000969 [Penicillium brevicompactum]